MLLLLLACASPSEGGCSWPDAAVAPDGVLESAADDCGWWALAVGDHLYVNVAVGEADATCDPPEMDAVLTENAGAIYSNLSGQGPKWTYDLVGAAAGETTVAITCSDGSGFSAKVTVE